jgi:hypothetical protein
VLANYCIILHNICPRHEIYSGEVLELRKSLFMGLRKASEDYSLIAPRDLCDLVSCLTKIKYYIRSDTPKWVDTELRSLSKQSAVAMGGMSEKGRTRVRDSFSMIDFYDVDLVNALKKFKLVKGSSKR